MPQTVIEKKEKSVKKLTSAQAKSVSPVDELKKAVVVEEQRRQILREFVTAHLQREVDYGNIAIAGRAGKPTLFKPGMEKLFSLLGITSTLEKDEETLSMIGVNGVVAYKCQLYRGPIFLGEGRGACTISEKARVNDAIKIAEKRARMDACLNLGFSEFFTQDLDDWDRDIMITGSQPADQNAAESTNPEEVTFRVDEKEEKVAKSGNGYAELQTDQGKVIAFKNTKDLFEIGKQYTTMGKWESRGDRKALVITAAPYQVREIRTENTPE